MKQMNAVVDWHIQDQIERRKKKTRYGGEEKNCGKHRGRIILASNKLTLQETFLRLEISTQRSSERTTEVHFFTLALVSDAESEK